MAEQPGESKRDESNKNSTSSRAADIVKAGSREAVSSQHKGGAKARTAKER